MNQPSNFLATIATSLGAATFFVLTVSGISFWSAKQTLFLNRQIAHHLQTLTTLELLISALEKSENMQRQYLLTESETVLEIFVLTMIEVDQEMRNLRDLVQGNLDQKPQIQQLEAYIINRLNQLEKGIELRQNKGLAVAIDYSVPEILDQVTLISQHIEEIEVVEIRKKKKQSKIMLSKEWSCF